MTMVWRSQFTLPQADLRDVYGLCRRWTAGARNDLVLPAQPAEGEWHHEVTRASATMGVSEDLDMSPYADGEAGRGAFALQVMRPVEPQGLTWTTELACEALDGSGTLVTIALSRQALPNRAPKLDQASVAPPRIAGQLLSRFAAPGIPPSLSEVRHSGEVPGLLNAILDAERAVPLIVVAEDNWSRQTFIPHAELTKLAGQLLGTASVVRLSKEAAFSFVTELTALGLDSGQARRWAVYNGAVRLYQPGCDVTRQSPFGHRLYLPDTVHQPEFLATLVQWCFESSTLVVRRPTRDLATLRLEALRRRAANAEDEGQWQGYALELDQRLRDEQKARQEDRERLGQQVQKLQAQLGQFEARDGDETETSEQGQESDGPPSLAYFARNGGRPVLDFVDKLADEDRDIALRYLTALPRHLNEGTPGLVEKVKGGKTGSPRSKLLEYRANTKDLWLRFFFARSTRSNEVLLLSGYAKKQNTLDSTEIAKAASCLSDAWEAGWQ